MNDEKVTSTPKIKPVLAIHHGHDATVVYIKDGEIVEAMGEERLSRQKKHMGFPFRSLAYVKEKYSLPPLSTVYMVGERACWDASILSTEEDNIRARAHDGHRSSRDYFYSLQYYFPLLRKALNFYYKLKTPHILKRVERSVNAFIEKNLPGVTIKRLHHHLAHAWAAVPFMNDTSLRHLIFTLDGAGDNISGSVNIFEDGKITKIKDIPFDSSIGLLYNGIVALLGMKPNEHEFKVMGLAPYAKKSSGEKVYNELRKLVWFDHDNMTLAASIQTSRSLPYFIANNFHNHRFDSLAYGVQKLTEELIKEMAAAYIAKYDIHHVAVGGGVFMNVKANQLLLDLKEIETLVVTPSCGDESLALGIAVYGFVQEGNDLKDLKKLRSLYLGSSYENGEIKKAIDAYAFTSKITIADQGSTEMSIEKKVAEILSKGHVVGRFKGRAEWGARALGNRSILANPKERETVKLINEMIKGRDFWMPFATSLLHEDQALYLENPRNFFAPYMSITFRTKEKAVQELSAALHPYDHTSRPQMVTKEMNEDYHTLLTEFKKLTGSSGILNTSFNLHGEPNVETPSDALRTFDLSGLKYLAIGDYLISKES